MFSFVHICREARWKPVRAACFRETIKCEICFIVSLYFFVPLLVTLFVRPRKWTSVQIIFWIYLYGFSLQIAISNTRLHLALDSQDIVQLFDPSIPPNELFRWEAGLFHKHVPPFPIIFLEDLPFIWIVRWGGGGGGDHRAPLYFALLALDAIYKRNVLQKREKLCYREKSIILNSCFP